MEIENYVCFFNEIHPPLLEYIVQNNVKHNSDDIGTTVFAMYSSDPHWKWIGNYVEKHKVHCLRDLIYSKEEKDNAQWMIVRTTWRYGYPEPSTDYKYEDIVYSKDNYCDKCGAGLKQKDSFRFKKVPNWGRRHFYAPFWIEDELFVSEAVKDIFINANITGISFREVKNKKGDSALQGIWQMYIENMLQPAFVEHNEYIEKISVCPDCARKKYLLQSVTGKTEQYKKEAFANASDIVKGYEIFGGMPLIAGHKIIINQKTYRAIADNKLDRGLMFYPIELV